MSLPGPISWNVGGVSLSMMAPIPVVEAGRMELEASVGEIPTRRVAAGPWECTIGGELFAAGASNVLLESYISGATNDVPYVQNWGSTAGDDADLILCKLFGPAVGGGARDGDGQRISSLRAIISSREPFCDSAKNLHYTPNTAGLTGNTDGTGVQLGAVGAGQELVIAAWLPTFPAMGGTALGTLTLEHDVADTWLATTTAVVSTGTNPWTTTAGTAGFMVWTMDGDTAPIAETWWRVTFTTITGTIWPRVAGGIFQKRWKI